MAVISVNQIWQGRVGDSDKNVRRHSRVFHVRTDTKANDDTVVKSHPLVPKVGAQHPNDPKAFVVRVSADNFAGAYLWQVTVTYSTEKEFASNPLNDPVRFSWNDEIVTEATLLHTGGTGVHIIDTAGTTAPGEIQANSAGDAYEPIDGEFPHKVVTIRYNVPDF